MHVDRCAAPSCSDVSSTLCFQGVEGVSGPAGIVGPSGHPVRTSSLFPSARLRCGSDGVTGRLLSLHRDPKVTKEVGGSRCVVLMNPRLSVCTVSLAWRRRSAASFALSAFISDCVGLFVVTSCVTRCCRGNAVRVMNAGRSLVSHFL